MKSKEKADELKKALKVEKKLVVQKDDELHTTLLRIVEARDRVILSSKNPSITLTFCSTSISRALIFYVSGC